MEKILLTIIYPFWYLFSKTLFGVIMVFCLLTTLPGILISIIIPDEFLGEASIGIGIISILLGFILFNPVISFSIYLERKYNKYGYYTLELF